jgi:hypothetical protein
MGRRPRSRATRAERRMQKERAASALAHGLPVPTPLPTRARSTESSSSRPPSSVPPGPRLSSTPPGRMPLAVKLLVAGLGLLGALYGLTLLRDHKDAGAARAPVVPESQAALVPPSVAPTSMPADAPAVTSPSLQVAAAPASGSASAPPGTMPLIAKRVKAAVAALAHKPQGLQPDASAVQPNVAAALVPAAPATPAVK